jgi:nitrite reductase (NADH) large subunit
VVAVESGWEIYVAGNGGIKVRVSDFLTKVATDDEVIEYVGAFMQMYREQGHHNERTAPWIERVSLSYIKEEIVDKAEQRKELYERFITSQKYAQVDPWKKRVEGFDKESYIPMADLVN